MTDDRITFDDENKSTSERTQPDEVSRGLTGVLIKSGIAKNAGQARFIQIIASILLLTLAVILFAKKPNADRYGNYDEMKREHPELFTE